MNFIIYFNLLFCLLDQLGHRASPFDLSNSGWTECSLRSRAELYRSFGGTADAVSASGRPTARRMRALKTLRSKPKTLRLRRVVRFRLKGEVTFGVSK